jgi:hypothetical protein
MCHELSAGKCGAVAGLPLKTQEKLITAGVSAASAAKWNAAGANAADSTAEIEDDPPMTCGAPVAA